MKIEYTGRQTEVPAELRKLAERKLGKLARLLPGITRAHVIFSMDRHREVAEVSVHSRRLDLMAREAGRDSGASLAAAVDKLMRQAQRQVGRRRERGRGSARQAPAGPPGPREPRGLDGTGPRIVRSRRPAGKPMSLEEAAAEVLTREEGVLVFRDPRTERVNVLYRRKDGNLGLIEPEA
jgi:putative sigma-54 modulation protein